MKRLIPLLAALFLIVTFPACDLFGGDDNSPDSLGGDTNIGMNTVGNQFSTGALVLGGTGYNVDGGMTVVENNNGEIKAELEIDVSNLRDLPGFDMVYDAIPSRYKDGQGNISTDIRFKSTSEGILDYANVDGEPHMLIKYSDGVGTQYTLDKSSGRTLTREIVSKSTEDDFPYGFFDIKVSAVDMVLNSGGVRKITYYANHKFGIVYAEATMDDGSKVGTYLYSAQD